MNQYIVGTLVEIDATFTDQFGTLMDPTDVTAQVRLPDGTVVVLTNQVSHVGLGVYKVAYTPEINGLYAYRFAGDGAVIAANEGEFMAQTTFPGV